MFFYDRGQEGAFERFTSREGDVFETAINVHGPFNGMGELSYYSGSDGDWIWGDDIPALEAWQHLAYVSDGFEISIYLEGELVHGPDPWSVAPSGFMHIGNRHNGVEGFDGLIDDVALWDEALEPGDIQTISSAGVDGYLHGGNRLQPGDADMDLDFDQLDLVRVQIAGKYLTGQVATWGEGDWNSAPGGEPGSPPVGDGLFNQLDIIAALGADVYLTGPYAARATRWLSGRCRSVGRCGFDPRSRSRTVKHRAAGPWTACLGLPVMVAVVRDSPTWPRLSETRISVSERPSHVSKTARSQRLGSTGDSGRQEAEPADRLKIVITTPRSSFLPRT